jgi:ribonuclease-3
LKLIVNFLKKLFTGRKKDRELRDIREFEKRIGYRFKNIAVLEQALSHSSYAFAVANNNLKSNERLEFLGDAVLGLVVSGFLFKIFPDIEEGELSKIRSLLISRKALKEAADKISLSEYLRLSRSEEKTGGRSRFSINTNTFEALIAAIYLDGGIKRAEQFIETHVLSMLDHFLKDEGYFNYKSKLLEHVQAETNEIPIYQVIDESGPDHNKLFKISVRFWGNCHGIGEGKTKKEAEQAAARAAFEAVRKIPPKD